MKRSSGTVRYAMLAIAAYGALEWAMLYDIGVLVGVTGCLMMIPVISVFIIAVFTKWRPAAGLIGVGRVASIAGVVIWAASAIAELKVHPTVSEEWRFGSGEISHTDYRTRSPQFPGAPDYDLRLRPALCPFGMAYIGMGHGLGGSSRTVGAGTWPLAACTGLPTLVLSRLRRDRIPPDVCRRCGYDLTGNVTGRCPECGESAATPSDGRA